MKWAIASAWMVAVLTQSVHIPLRIPGGSAANVFTAADLDYQGIIRVPADGIVDVQSAFGGIGGRVVGGNQKIFLYGTWGGHTPAPVVWEFDVQGLTPNPVLASAPRGSGTTAWGDISGGTSAATGVRRDWLSPPGSLTASMSSGTTSMSLSGGGSISSVGAGTRLWVDNEVILVNSAAGLPNLSGVSRAQLGTSAAAHSNGATVYVENDVAGTTAVPESLYWNETQQLLSFTYNVTYTGTNLYTMACASLDNPVGPAITTYGPYNFTSTDQHGTALSATRAYHVWARPSDGKMCLGNASKSGDAGLAWGPSMYCGASWPTTGSAGGRTNILTPFAVADEYLDYQLPSFTPLTGAPIGPVTSFQIPLSTGLTYAYEYPVLDNGHQANPSANGGRGTWSGSTSDANSTVWIEGVHKSGVFFFGKMAAGAGTDPSDCTNTTHLWYLNSGQIQTTLSGVVGTFNPGDRVQGATSGHTATVGPSGYLNSYLFMSQDACADCGCGFCDNTFNFTGGETLNDTTTGTAHATVGTFHRNDICAHNCACVQCASAGDSLTVSTPIMWIYDPADLEAVKNGATDYATSPHDMVDMVSQYGVLVAAQNIPSFAKSIQGAYYNATSHLLYLDALAADNSRVPGGETALLVFYVNDVAPPEPLSLAWFKSLAPDWLHKSRHAKPFSLFEQPLRTGVSSKR